MSESKPLRPSLRPPISLGLEWSNHPGYIQGLTQASLSGAIYVADDAPPSGLDLTPLVLQLTGLAPSEAATFNPLNASLLQQCLCLYRWIQQENKIPVFADAVAIPQTASDRTGCRQFTVFLPYHLPDLGLAVLAWCCRVVNNAAALAGQVDFPRQDDAQPLSDLPRLLAKSGLKGINNFHFVRAAHALGIQVTPMAEHTNLYGWGSAQRTLQSGLTDLTSYLGVTVSQSKSTTAKILSARGIPVPLSMEVRSLAQALSATARFGFPVVVKPDDQDQGRGVFANLRSTDAVEAAYRDAQGFSRTILVQKHVPGQDYRLTVVGREVVKVTVRQPGGVLGDGQQSIEALVTETQKRDDLARHFRLTGTHLIQLDAEAIGLLDEQGLKTSSILPAGTFLPLRRKSNASAGGSQLLVDAATVHADNMALAIRVTRSLGLDIAGIDLICPDIRLSWLDVGACVIEVNSRPQISVVHTPLIYQHVLSRLIPNAGSPRVHMVVLLGETPIPDHATLTDLAQMRGCDSFVSKQGACTGDRRIFGPQNDGFLAARMVMFDEQIQSLLCVMHADELVRYGSPFLQLTSVEQYPALPNGIQDAGAAFSIVSSLIHHTPAQQPLAAQTH